METTTFEHQTKTQKIHTYEGQDLHPFAILEERTIEEEQEVVNYSVVLGNARCDERVFNNKFSCEEYIASKPYSLITALFLHLTELLEKYKQQQQFQREQEQLKNAKQ